MARQRPRWCPVVMRQADVDQAVTAQPNRDAVLGEIAGQFRVDRPQEESS